MFGIEGFGKKKAEFEIDESDHEGHDPYNSAEDPQAKAFADESLGTGEVRAFNKENPAATDPSQPIEPPAGWREAAAEEKTEGESDEEDKVA